MKEMAGLPVVGSRPIVRPEQSPAQLPEYATAGVPFRPKAVRWRRLKNPLRARQRFRTYCPAPAGGDACLKPDSCYAGIVDDESRAAQMHEQSPMGKLSWP